jgi:hypothetical protein
MGHKMLSILSSSITIIDGPWVGGMPDVTATITEESMHRTEWCMWHLGPLFKMLYAICSSESNLLSDMYS